MRLFAMYLSVMKCFGIAMCLCVLQIKRYGFTTFIAFGSQ